LGINKSEEKKGSEKERWSGIPTSLAHAKAGQTSLKGIGNTVERGGGSRPRASLCVGKPRLPVVCGLASYSQKRPSLSDSAGPQCRAPGQLSQQCVEADWQGEEETVLFWLLLQTALD